MNLFYRDCRGRIVDESGQESTAFVVDKSFRLTNLTNLHKNIKNKKAVTEIEEPKDIDMQEVPTRREKKTQLTTSIQTRIDCDTFMLSKKRK
jgi:hypothetical protein